MPCNISPRASAFSPEAISSIICLDATHIRNSNNRMFGLLKVTPLVAINSRQRYIDATGVSPTYQMYETNNVMLSCFVLQLKPAHETGYTRLKEVTTKVVQNKRMREPSQEEEPASKEQHCRNKGNFQICEFMKLPHC